MESQSRKSAPALLLKLGFVSTVVWLALLALPSAAQKPRVFLEGRIEQIAGSSQLSEIVLRAQKPKLDTRPILQSGTQVSGYPVYLLGRWGGHLKVVWSVKAPEITTPLHQHRVGNIGSAIFHFGKVSGKVKLLPAAIYFPLAKDPVTESLMNELKVKSENMEAVISEARETGVFTHVPILFLAGFDSESLTGKKFKSRMIHNSTRELRPGTVEQDVVVGDWENNSYTAYHEVVSRFTWYGTKKVYAQVMFADYMKNRRAIRRTLLEGWIDTDWEPIADSISSRFNKPWPDIMKEDGLE